MSEAALQVRTARSNELTEAGAVTQAAYREFSRPGDPTGPAATSAATSPRSSTRGAAPPAGRRRSASIRRRTGTVRAMMRRAVDDGRIVTVDPPAGRPRAETPDEAARYVCKQERCRRCGSAVESWTLGGRTAYACPVDQPAA